MTTNSWHGKLELVFLHKEGKTQVGHTFCQAPLKVQRPFYPEGPEVCHSVILHTAGGIVGGDRLSQTFQLQPQAQTLLTNTAATKVYRSNGQQARQEINITLGTNAYLEFFPQETIVFNGAVYQQELRVELAPEARWLGWEITRFGRSARGEKFLQGDWRSHTEVWQQGNPLWIDRQWLPGGEDTFHHPHGLAGKPVVGTLSWLGQAVSSEVVTKSRNLGDSLVEEGETGVTQITSGLLCRYRGDSTTEVRNWFREVWQLLRLTYFGKSAIRPRVWPI